jgi:hypothetical protein
LAFLSFVRISTDGSVRIWSTGIQIPFRASENLQILANPQHYLAWPLRLMINNWKVLFPFLLGDADNARFTRQR